MNSGGGLFGDTLDFCRNLGELSGAFGEVLPKNLQNDLPPIKLTGSNLKISKLLIMLPRRISPRQLRFNGHGDDPYDRCCGNG